MVLGQQKVVGKPNEITAIPILLDLLDIEGTGITADAKGCQKELRGKRRCFSITQWLIYGTKR
jgi:predicted transposase YbfD/YdcC